MIEIATLRSAVGLFKDFLLILARNDENKRDLFSKTIQPLYKELEKLAREYYHMLSSARYQLDDGRISLSKILKELQEKRGNIVIGRNGLLGEAFALQKYYSGIEERYKGPLEVSAVKFARSVLVYFHGVSASFHLGADEGVLDLMIGITGDPAEGRIMSLATRLGVMISQAKDDGRDSAKDREDLIYFTERTLAQLESNWLAISASYNELRMLCVPPPLSD